MLLRLCIVLLRSVILHFHSNLKQFQIEVVGLSQILPLPKIGVNHGPIVVVIVAIVIATMLFSFLRMAGRPSLVDGPPTAYFILLD